VTERDPNELLTVGEVADQLKVKAATVRRWINEDLLTARRLGGGKEFRVRRADLDSMLQLEPRTSRASHSARRPFAATTRRIRTP
jgi:excisionase family DNA binding protein